MHSKLYPEECCEICGEIVHCHFDCPVCKKGHEPTSLYGEQCLDSRMVDFSCEKCKTEFTIVKRIPTDWEILVEIEEVKK